MAHVLVPAEKIVPTYGILAYEPVQMLTLCDKHKPNNLKTYYKE